ncbi:hypothetical protein Ddye_011427 [Dipteronia dyeriana]|uniref:MAPK kinase substrate protein n=1 Tax=Dipteronia dyeriana TaxID=168575 RepID=A0AAD9X2G9_9ROSI|nr:hypothetical protein Ddye_011427 [Dipteronia dyeriana]
MEGLQRSAVSFRRQGSSGLIWDDKFLAELNQATNQKQEQHQLQPEQQQQDSQPPEHEKADADADNNIKEVKPSISINTSATTIERSRSNGGGRGFRTGRVSPAIEPPSPRLSACGFCSAFSKPSKTLTKKKGKRRSR